MVRLIRLVLFFKATLWGAFISALVFFLILVAAAGIEHLEESWFGY